MPLLVHTTYLFIIQYFHILWIQIHIQVHLNIKVYMLNRIEIKLIYNKKFNNLCMNAPFLYIRVENSIINSPNKQHSWPTFPLWQFGRLCGIIQKTTVTDTNTQVPSVPLTRHITQTTDTHNFNQNVKFLCHAIYLWDVICISDTKPW